MREFISSLTPSRARTVAALMTGLALMAVGRATGQTSRADSVGVLAVVDQFHRTMEAGDSNGVMATLAPEVLVIEGGTIENRDEYRAHHLAADIAFTLANPSVRTVTRASVTGDQAWVVSTSTGKREVRGQPVEAISAELIVLRRTGPTWRIVAIHWSSRTRRVTP